MLWNAVSVGEWQAMENEAVSKAIEAVLDIARWAPSGDNAQPWMFRITGDREVEVLIRRTNPNIYEYRHGEPTLISAGALLENIEIAAPVFGLKARWRYAASADGIDRIVVFFDDDISLSVPELFCAIPKRSVDRRRFKKDALTSEQKQQLGEALNQDMQVQWYDSLADRRKIGGLSALATNIRLTIPETFDVHRSVVEWDRLESEDKIPSRALGLDPLTLKLTRWSMRKWSRTKLMNALGAPYLAALQMDVLPAFFCASYFAIRVKRRSGDAEVQALRAGQAIQRFWLTATNLDLVMQPCVAILAFWTYGAGGRNFTVLRKAQRTATQLATRAQAVFGRNDDIVFLARIGRPRGPSPGRSTRLPLTALIGNGES
jgi:nitroreductase